MSGTTNASRGGFTLLELVLAIGLSVAIVTLVGFAVQFLMRSVDRGRLRVEEAQLARSLLHRIEGDLLSALRYEPQDTSTIEALATANAAFDVDSLDDDSTTQNESDAIASDAAPPPVPGVYGNQFELQVDTSRLPRPDEMATVVDSAGSFRDRVSDVKTVAYFVRSGDIVNADSAMATRVAQSASTGSNQAVSGLVRRQLDRATAAFAAENGNLQLIGVQGDLLAPEVARVEFSYFDGSQWLPEWDTDDIGGLPLAVHVKLWLRSRAIAPASTEPIPARELPLSYYQLIVRLPNAEPIPADEGTGESS